MIKKIILSTLIFYSSLFGNNINIDLGKKESIIYINNISPKEDKITNIINENINLNEIIFSKNVIKASLQKNNNNNILDSLINQEIEYLQKNKENYSYNKAILVSSNPIIIKTIDEDILFGISKEDLKVNSNLINLKNKLKIETLNNTNYNLFYKNKDIRYKIKNNIFITKNKCENIKKLIIINNDNIDFNNTNIHFKEKIFKNITLFKKSETEIILKKEKINCIKKYSIEFNLNDLNNTKSLFLINNFNKKDNIILNNKIIDNNNNISINNQNNDLIIENIKLNKNKNILNKKIIDFSFDILNKHKKDLYYNYFINLNMPSNNIKITLLDNNKNISNNIDFKIINKSLIQFKHYIKKNETKKINLKITYFTNGEEK